jgi:tetratricopeptide (TPR) repeat protein
MKLAAIVVVLGIGLGGVSQAFCQAGNTQPTGQAAPAGQTAAPAAAPQGKRPPQAKTQPEFDAFNTAKALTDAAAQEKAADDFAVKFPDSELRVMLYKAVMYSYQQANNADKMMDAAHKVLTVDGDDPEALVGVGQVLAERTRDTDLDKDQRWAEARKNAQKALLTVETDVPTAGLPQDKIDTYKGYLRSEAYSIIGTLDFTSKAWPDAETNLRKSIEAFPQNVDSIAVFRLSVALDMQGKYAEAMKYADQAVGMTKDDTAAGKAARAEKDRLTKLTSGSAPAQTPAPPK